MLLVLSISAHSVHIMSKAFVKESGDEPLTILPEMPTGVRNYITPAGYQHLQIELQHLLESLRIATEGDERNTDLAVGSSEMQVREIEQRIHYLQTRLETAEIVDPSGHAGEQQIFFGATVTYRHEHGEQHTVTIVGLDELDPANGKISWLSPVAQALLKAFEGDSVTLKGPSGDEELHVLSVLYPPIVELDADFTGLTNKGVG